MHLNKKLLALAATATLTLGLAGCGGGAAEPGGSDDSIVIGIKYDQPGLGQQEGNTFTGFDVEVAKYVAKELGFEGDKVTFKESPS